MLSKTILFRWGILLMALIFACPLICPAQNSAEELRKYLHEQAAFSEGDFAALDRGETVVKLLPTDEKKKVSVFGIVRLQNVDAISMAELRDGFSQKGSKAVLDF